MSDILIVEDSRTQALQIQLLLENLGFEVRCASNGREALAELEKHVPEVVLTDLDMPELNGLELVEAVRQDYASVPVILMTAMGSEEIAVQALQKGAAGYIPRRNLNRDIAATLHDVLEVARASQHQERALACLNQAEFHFVLENDIELVAPLIEFLEGSLVRMDRCDRNELMRVGMALHEALVNAIQHGNLEVGTELRQQDERVYYNLTRDRRGQRPYRDRRVQVSAKLTPHESVFVVADEGPGFDTRTVPDPNDPANLERIGGRGLILIRTFMDRVEHNDRGNRIAMTKRHRLDGAYR